MNLEELRQHKPEIEAIAAKYGIENIRVFGSVARGEATDESDVDLLVTLGKPIGWEITDLRYELKEVTGHLVDVITESGLSAHVKAKVMEDAKPL